MNPWKISTLVLASLLTLVIGRSALPLVYAEAQPHMQSALDHLKSAKEELEKATPDKGGHRVKAISLTKSAIAQVEKGIAWDNAHHKEAAKAPAPAGDKK